MQFTSLSTLKGSIQENLTPILTALDSKSLQVSPEGMAKLGAVESTRVEVIMTTDKQFFIGIMNNNKGLSLSKNGRFQKEAIATGIQDFFGGKAEISDEKVEHDGVTWHKLIKFVAPIPVETEAVSAKFTEEATASEEAKQEGDSSNGEGSAVEQAEARAQTIAEAESEDARDNIPEMEEEGEF